jgi:hypothetical protein
MTATPVPPLMPAASTTPDTATTRISNPKALIILRIVWLALLALEILYTAYILPISVNPENFRAQRPEEIALLEQYGIARAAYAANTALADVAQPQ